MYCFSMFMFEVGSFFLLDCAGLLDYWSIFSAGGAN